MKTKFLLILACMMTLLASCSQSPQHRLHEEVKAAQKNMPEYLGDEMYMTKVEYIGGDVVYTISFNEDILPLSDPEIYDIMSQGMTDAFLDGSDADMREIKTLCQEAGANIIFDFESTQGNTYSFTIKP